MDPTLPELADSRRRLKILGGIALGLGSWGFYYSFVVIASFQQLDIDVWGSGLTGGFQVLDVPMAPVVVGYCFFASALLLLGGAGLLRDRRWGPILAAPAGISWSATSATIFVESLRVLTAMGPRVPPPLVRSLQLSFFLNAGCALLVLLYAVALSWAAVRRRGPLTVRAGMALMAWGTVSGGISWRWYDWISHLLIP